MGLSFAVASQRRYLAARVVLLKRVESVYESISKKHALF